MKKLIYLLLSILFIGSCTKMNDKHDEFLSKGETVYIGKVDSMRTFPGNERIMFRYWLSDPRAKSITAYWGTNNDSAVFVVPPHQPVDSFDIQINAVDEGNYSFQWISRDEHRNKSIPFEIISSVYGERYNNRLINRRIVQSEIQGNNAIITWTGSVTSQEIGIEFSYRKTSGIIEILKINSGDLSTPLVLEDIDPTYKPVYQTLFLPEPQSIDTFYAKPAYVDMVERVNIALGKQTAVSDVNSSSTGGNRAVDGDNTSSGSRWVTNDSHNAHWIEIYFEAEYEINAFQTWSDNLNNAPAQAQFRFEADINGEWVPIVTETQNSLYGYYAEFEAVTTSKVRYYIPAYQTNRVRLFEISVYSIIHY